MNDEMIIEFDDEEMPNLTNDFYFRPSIDRLRIILMFFMCINLFGFPTALGNFVKTICGFVPIAFFIISGYLVLREDDNRSKRIARAIKRTAIVFCVLAVVYFFINYFYYNSLNVNILSAFKSKRFWFNFLALNLWQFDIGGAIWYVQALLYAYIIIYFLDKFKLLRFDWLIAALLILFTVFTGELSGVFKWNILGYTYLPGNFLTRALPYVLLGSFMHKKIERFSMLWRGWFLVGIACGIVLIVSEILLLAILKVPGYYGHLIGMPVIAVCACMLAFQDKLKTPGFEKMLGMSRWHINCIYYFAQLIEFAIVLFVVKFAKDNVTDFMGLIGIFTFVFSFCLAWLISFIGRMCSKKTPNE